MFYFVAFFSFFKTGKIQFISIDNKDQTERKKLIRQERKQRIVRAMILSAQTLKAPCPGFMSVNVLFYL